MELYEANKILRTVKTALATDGLKIPAAAETDGLMMLLGKLDAEKYLAPKIKHARASAKNSAAYAKLYNHIVFFRALQAAKHMAISDPVTSVSVMLLHKLLFGDFDDGAGKPRTKPSSTNGSAHTDPKYIPGSLKSIIAKMNEIASAPQTGKEDFAVYLSHYMRELIILHPFDCGSEFTVRMFMILFAKTKGFGLGYHRTTAATVKSAESAAFVADDVAPLYKMLLSCLMYETITAEPVRKTVQTKREISQELIRQPRPERADQTKIAPAAHKKQPMSDDEVLKRAVRLQQKIAKLNEQLTELITPQEDADGE